MKRHSRTSIRARTVAAAPAAYGRRPLRLCNAPRVVGLLVVLGMAWFGSRGQAAPPHEPMDLVPRPVGRVAPGTIVGAEAPHGWSDLVIKSGSYIHAGDVADLSRNERHYARLFSTVMLANVRQQPLPGGGERHVLTHVAVGCMTTVGQRDMVVSPSTQKKLGADLGFLGNLLLGEIYKKQQGVVCVMRSPSMAVVDAPVAVHHDGTNRVMIFRYSLLVDPVSGQLNRLVWLLDPDQRNPSDRVASPLQLLAENHVQDFGLHVDSDHYRFGIPTETAFGVIGLPTGKRQFQVDDTYRPLLGLQRYTADQVAVMQAYLSSLVQPVKRDEEKLQVTKEPAPPRSLDDRRARMRQPVLRQRRAN